MSGTDFNLTALIILGTVFFLAHVGLLISSRWLNLLMLVAAGYLLLSPMSAATSFPLVVPAKYGRIYCTVLVILLGFLVARVYRIRPVGIMFLAFVGLYALAGLWSDSPLDAIKYKGLYFAVVISGFFVAYALRSLSDFTNGMRLFGLACAGFAALIVLDMARNPSAISHVGRLAAWGMNGNRIGQTAAPMLTICAYLALYDPAKMWKVFGYCVGAVLGIIIIYTGSRGAAAEGMLGCFIVGIPLMKRPGLFAVVLIMFSITVYLAYTYSGASDEASSRFLDVSLDTRADPWSEAEYYMQGSPVFGVGWVSQIGSSGGETTQNMHSMYMQVAVEAGLVGLAVLFLAMLAIFVKGWNELRNMRAVGTHVHTMYFAVAMLVSIFAHGALEAGTITGSLVNSMLLPFAIGLLDRLPELQEQELLADELEWEHGYGADNALEYDEMSDGQTWAPAT
ncbi:MAG: O-antigen ligase family protein [Phycisphaerales bacterium]